MTADENRAVLTKTTRVAAGALMLLTALAVPGCASPATVAGSATKGPPPAASPSPLRATSAPARDGGLQFIVVDVTRRDQAGDPGQPGLSVTAHGVFVVVTLSIRNVSDSPLTFLDRDQTLVDEAGTTFTADMAADIYGNRDVPSTRIAPGGELLVHICFDVPVDTVPRNLVLRQSDSSPGVTVAISN